VRALALLVALLALAGAALAAEPPAPLTNEDVVRMIASGASEAAILDAVRTRACAFDLSEEMVEELKLAGVSPAVLAAMAARATKPVPAELPPERVPVGAVLVTVTLPERTLKAPAWADEDVKERLALPKENAQREVRDLAVFLACEATTHVPDQWRSKTPLGRDMSPGLRRHEMLAFVAGDTPAGKPPRLVLPHQIEVRIDGTEPHDLVLGVAARIGDRWVQLAAGRLPAVSFRGEPGTLEGEIHGGGFAPNVALARPRERRVTDASTPASTRPTPPS